MHIVVAYGMNVIKMMFGYRLPCLKVTHKTQLFRVLPKNFFIIRAIWRAHVGAICIVQEA